MRDGLNQKLQKARVRHVRVRMHQVISTTGIKDTRPGKPDAAKENNRSFRVHCSTTHHMDLGKSLRLCRRSPPEYLYQQYQELFLDVNHRKYFHGHGISAKLQDFLKIYMSLNSEATELLWRPMVCS